MGHLRDIRRLPPEEATLTWPVALSTVPAIPERGSEMGVRYSRTVATLAGFTLSMLVVIGVAQAQQGTKAPEPVKTHDQTAAVAPVTTTSGLQYIDFKVGDGASPKPGEIAIVHYTGWLEDGKKFDSSKDRGKPFGFKVGIGQVIKGWDEGVASMKVGGVRRLIIPPELGYGAKGAGNVVPPNARLIFDVELLRVQP